MSDESQELPAYDRERPRTSPGEVGRSGEVPFELPDEEEEDIFSSVPADSPKTQQLYGGEIDQAIESAQGGAPAQRSASSASGAAGGSSQRRTSGAHQAVSSERRSQGRRRPQTRVTVLGPQDNPLEAADMRGHQMLMGRQFCDLSLDDPFVSRWHARLFVHDDALMLEDMESHNGVYLRIADELMLEDGDEILVGRQRFVFKTDWEDDLLRYDERPASNSGQTRTLGGSRDGVSATRLLQVLEGGHIGGVYSFHGPFLLGAGNARLQLGHDAEVAHEHARVEKRGSQFFLHDGDGPEGTFIRIHDAVEVIDGDIFTIGRTRMRINRRS